jgi:hypothetical protein
MLSLFSIIKIGEGFKLMGLNKTNQNKNPTE